MAEKIVRKPIRIKSAINKYEYIIIPTFAVMNVRNYYGYPVIVIAFGWLCFRFKVEFGVKIVRSLREKLKAIGKELGYAGKTD